MKLILLCAGYGTRLEKDLESCNNQELKSLKGVPKPLIPVSGQPLISHWLKQVEDIKEIDEVYVVTNNLFYEKFCIWKSKLNNQKFVEIVNDGTDSNEKRLGAVADIQLVVQKYNLQQDDLLIVAGDTLFYPDFSLLRFIRKFLDLNAINPSSNLIVHCPCPEEKVHLHGIVELGWEEKADCERVLSFLEKPNPKDTTSRNQCPCCYLISSESLKHLEQFLAITEMLPLSSKDAPGNFVAYLISKAKVYSFGVSGRFDIGNLDSYLECCKNFTTA